MRGGSLHCQYWALHATGEFNRARAKTGAPLRYSLSMSITVDSGDATPSAAGRYAARNHTRCAGCQRAVKSQGAAGETIVVLHILSVGHTPFAQQFDDVTRGKGQRTKSVSLVQQKQRACVIDAHLAAIACDAVHGRQPTTTLPDLPGRCDQVGAHHQVECQHDRLSTAMAEMVGNIQLRILTGTGHDRRYLQFE